MKTAEGTGSLLRPIQRESVVWNMITSKSIIYLLVCGRFVKRSNLFTFRKTATIGFFLKVVLSKICLSIFNHHVSSHSIVKHILIICKVSNLCGYIWSKRIICCSSCCYYHWWLPKMQRITYLWVWWRS